MRVCFAVRLCHCVSFICASPAGIIHCKVNHGLSDGVTKLCDSPQEFLSGFLYNLKNGNIGSVSTRDSSYRASIPRQKGWD